LTTLNFTILKTAGTNNLAHFYFVPNYLCQIKNISLAKKACQKKIFCQNSFANTLLKLFININASEKCS
jgi:hypothetical protein